MLIRHFHFLPILKVALQKVFDFSISHIFETRVAGRMVADMCRAAVKVSLGFLD